MWLIKKYKFVSILLLLLILVSCAKSSTNLRFDTDKVKSKVINTEKEKVEVIRDDNLSSYENQTIYGESKDFFVDINSRLPVYIITGRFNSLSSVYGQIFCDSMNNDFVNNKYLCIIQSQNDLESAYKFLRKDDLTTDPEANYTADFLITRTDYLLDKQKNNSGPLQNFPTLDVVMFLNGSYLFLWGDSKYKSIELSHFVTKFHEAKPNTTVKIAVANSLAKTLITKVILSNKWATNFEFINLDEGSMNASTRDYSIIAYAGPSIDKKLINYINVYNKDFVPLSLADYIIYNVQKSNPEISDANVAQYFPSNGLFNIANLVSSLDNNSIPINTNTEFNRDSNDKQSSCSNNANNSNLPFINDVKFGADYDRYIFGKSKFNFNLRAIEDILSVDKITNISNIKIASVGIRNVLVATRATNPVLVFSLLSSILSKHDLIKINFSTPDMKGYNINNLITGNLYDNRLIYHYGVINFMNYATNNSSSKLWDKEAEIVGIINKYLDEKNFPPFYGPSMPNSNEVNTINNESHNRIIINKQEKVLENFKSIIETIKEEMKESDKKSIDNTVDNRTNQYTQNTLNNNIGELIDNTNKDSNADKKEESLNLDVLNLNTDINPSLDIPVK